MNWIYYHEFDELNKMMNWIYYHNYRVGMQILSAK